MRSMIISDNFASVVFPNGKPATLNRTHPSFDAFMNALRSKDWKGAEAIAFPAEQLKKKLEKADVGSQTAGRVRVSGGLVLVDDKAVHNTLTARIIKLLDQGFDVAPMVNFLANLLDNPSYRAVNELYGFLESTKLPITEDGHFLAYKRVRSDWKDERTGTMDNSVGKVVQMERNAVNEDPNQTCSAGLHFCGRDYLGHYGSCNGGRIVIVKINPRDVVAIPTDYNNQKGRACRYEVIGEMKLETEQTYATPVEKLETVDVAAEVIQVIKSVSEHGAAMYYIDSKDAAVNEGLTPSAINRVLRGERKSAGGVAFSYVTVAKPSWDQYLKTGDGSVLEQSLVVSAGKPIEGYDYDEDETDEDDDYLFDIEDDMFD